MWYGSFKKAGAEMAKVYSRVSKINNVVGRSDYISNPDRQEFIKLTGKSSDFEWEEYAQFEKENQKSQEKNNEARELVIALPNEMSESFSDDVLEELKQIDVSNLTPMDALNTIFRLQNKLKNRW